MNYLHKFLLIEAERHRVLGDAQQAAELYDRAIALADEQEYIQEAAIGYELAAKFYLTRKKLVFAKACFQEARYRYQQWGATAKIQDLEKQYPHLLQQPSPKSPPSLTTNSSTTGSSEVLDLETVMRASQAIASERVLDRLLATLLNIAIKNAGAEIGWLILQTEGKLWIEAIGTDPDQTNLIQSVPLESSRDVCVALINYVARTQKSIVLRDATCDEKFSANEYVIRKQAKSILAMPLIHQSGLVGVLYLENNLTVDAFKPEQTELLNLLSTQMAIAIENVRLLTHQKELLKRQEELNRSLQQEQEQISRILERVTDGFIAVDRAWQIIYVNQKAEQKLGKSSQALIGTSLWNAYPEAVSTAFYPKYQEAIVTGQPSQFEEYYPPLNRWFELSVYPDRAGLSIFFRDITERKQMQAKLVHDALHDALTGLPNRLMLTERLDQAIQRAKRDAHYRFAVLFLDVDRFKVINDSLGHLVGDELLVAIARRLEACLTPRDTIARFGGDEFFILLDNPENEAQIAAQVQLALNAPFDLNGYKVFNTVSIGIVSSLMGCDRPEELLRAADIAMYQAKNEGKARYIVFDS
ncbi:MAG TPA: diguanylate cyclase, partial [Allocoleopsis sp.]